jgi:amino acid adenylation domain-containing protein
MVPAIFVTLEQLPLTPNGKVDRKALPAPERTGLEAEYVAPRTPTEEKVAQIWAEVLKVERVGIHDNFFELGGHSLLAVTLIERMRRAGLHADVGALFTTSTLAELAQAVGSESGEVEVPPNRIPAGCETISPEMLPLVSLMPEEIARIAAQVPGGARNIQDIYPLAPLQEGILFHHLMAREGDPYLLRIFYTFDSRARLDRYLEALQSVIDRHDILRTAVLWEGLAEPVQVVWRKALLEVGEVHLEPSQGDIAQQLRARFDPRRYRLDVREAPLLKIFIAEDRANARWVMLELFHHLAIDHTAVEVMQQEIQAYLQGQADKLPVPLPFRNFVAQARLGVAREEHEAHFKQLLGDVEEPTAPFGLTDVQGEGSGITEARRLVDAPLAERLRERARAQGVSAAALCHLAYAQVLARTSGREDVVFGTVLFGRMQSGEGAERALGLFINTLPVRIRVGEASVEESVKSTHAQLAQLLRHEHASLALAQRCSSVAAPAPLFSSVLNYRHGALSARASTAEALRAWEGIRYLEGEERTNYPLVLSVSDLGEGLALTAQAQSPIDPERVCAYMLRALEELVGALERAPAAALRVFDVLPESERRQLLAEWNDTKVDYPADALMHELFEAQAARTPDRIAVVHEERGVSYGELNARANRLAHYLRSLGVKPDARVAICVERGIEMMVGLLAILKAGGAYVPLDPSYPVERLTYMLEDSAPVAILTDGRVPAPVQAELRSAVVGGAHAVPVIDLQAADGAWTTQPATNPKRTGAGLSSANLAYVIYTSGSTGKPKGVMLPHRAVVNFLLSMARAPGLQTDDVLVAVTTLSFDIAVLELQLPLTLGARVVIATRDETMDGRALGVLLQRHRATAMQATPATWRLLLEAGWSGDSPFKALVGGEALPRELAERLLACGVELWNMYGPTETTVWSTCARITDTAGGITIGEPIANTTIYILDAQKNLCPIGAPGELCIGGAGVALGYWNRPELSAERFIADPFSAAPGATLYRTGDRARWRDDGTLEHLGRVDFQVKLRGYRIELGEIESALGSHPAVRETVVLAREDSPGDKRLVAYVVGKGEAPSAVELKDHLASQLPPYMVPATFVTLEQLPLTPNGKVDRKALPAPERSGSHAAYVAPRNATEEKLAQIWAEVLKVERVGVHDNFFELGGHSLLAMQVNSRMHGSLQVNLPLRELFAAPNIAQLGAIVDATLGERQRGTARVRVAI